MCVIGTLNLMAVKDSKPTRDLRADDLEHMITSRDTKISQRSTCLEAPGGSHRSLDSFEALARSQGYPLASYSYQPLGLYRLYDPCSNLDSTTRPGLTIVFTAFYRASHCQIP